MADADFDILAEGYDFCEAPRADEDGTVWFSDLTEGGYYRCRPGEVPETILAERTWIGGATRDAHDDMLCGGKGGLVLLSHGAVHPVLSEINGKPIVAVNDIEADRTGAIYGGTIDFGAVFERGEQPIGGIFFHLKPSGELIILRDDVVASVLSV